MEDAQRMHKGDKGATAAKMTLNFLANTYGTGSTTYDRNPSKKKKKKKTSPMSKKELKERNPAAYERMKAREDREKRYREKR